MPLLHSNVRHVYLFIYMLLAFSIAGCATVSADYKTQFKLDQSVTEVQERLSSDGVDFQYELCQTPLEDEVEPISNCRFADSVGIYAVPLRKAAYVLWVGETTSRLEIEIGVQQQVVDIRERLSGAAL